jgi:predicted acetyltransferase
LFLICFSDKFIFDMPITVKLNDLSGPLPTATYDIYEGGICVGMCQLRHIPGKSETMPEGFESNIYYEIDEAYRGRGYAKAALKLMLSAARHVGLSVVILTVAEDNVPSQRVIEAYNAELLATAPDAYGEPHRKYHIVLN